MLFTELGDGEGNSLMIPRRFVGMTLSSGSEEGIVFGFTTGGLLVRQAGWLVQLLSSNCINSSG